MECFYCDMADGQYFSGAGTSFKRDVNPSRYSSYLGISFFIEIGFQFDHYVVSFRNIIEPLNAYKELLLRKDAAYCLLERYRLVHSIAAEIWHPKALEILFSQEAFLSQLDYKEKKEAVRLAFEKDQIRQDNPAHANSLTREISWFLIGRVMRNAEYAPFMKEMEANEALRVF